MTVSSQSFPCYYGQRRRPMYQRAVSARMTANRKVLFQILRLARGPSSEKSGGRVADKNEAAARQTLRVSGRIERVL